MEAFGIVLLWLHLMAIAVAGAAAFGIPVVGAAARRGTADHRPVLMAVAGRLSMAGRGALVVLLVTGPLLIWARYGGVPPGPWFSIKMVVVLLLTATVILSGFNAKWMAAGDKAALTRAPLLAKAGMALLALTVLFAVLTFR